jgi:hypothetical protein
MDYVSEDTRLIFIEFLLCAKFHTRHTLSNLVLTEIYELDSSNLILHWQK